MAEAVRRGSYDPYRNLSYAYDGSAARVLDGRTAAPQTRERTQQREMVRPKAEVRPAGKVSPFAVVGFAAVAVMAIMVLMSLVTLSTVSGEVVELSNEMTRLKSEEATLLARYELAYDLGAIESKVTADGSMSRPQPGQMVYVDLTEPDNVVVYGAAVEEAAPGFWDSIEEAIGNALAYFQGEAS